MRILRLAGLATALAFPASLTMHAQVQNAPENRHTLNHGEIAAFGDYFRFSPPGHNAVNFLGLGARVGVNVHPNVALEAEMSYDFEQNYTTVGTNGGTTTTINSKVRPMTGLFGPKFQFGTSGPFRAFVTGKAGFMQFNASHGAASAGSFTNDLDNFGGSSTHFAAYPGGGIEAFLGPIGLRAEAGDEIYVFNGAHNNLRMTFGPSIRF